MPLALDVTQKKLHYAIWGKIGIWDIKKGKFVKLTKIPYIFIVLGIENSHFLQVFLFSSLHFL